jgi:uncharacterized protein (TIGR02453 family)
VARYFTPGVFKFLRELEVNNNKDWWEDNKDRYIETIREPSLEFISDFSKYLDRIAPHLTANAKTVGGSLMRPYRDMRFTSDKTPYKTNVGIQFRHESGKDVHAPGFYLHLQPSENFAGSGMWSPEPKVANRIRERIHDDAGEWKKAAHSSSFSGTWTISHPEEALKRVPSQFDPDHQFADDIRLKSFMAGAKLTQKFVTSSDFDQELASMFEKAGPFNAFLCKAIGLPY